MREGQLLKKSKTGLSLFSFIVMLLAFCSASFAQQAAKSEQASIEISGTVKDAAGKPLNRVSIMVKGSTEGTVTDDKGFFKIRVSKGATITVSSVGYKSQDIKIGQTTQFNLVLADEALSLDEVVITGYQTVSKDKTTGSYEKLSGAVMQQRPTKNILDKLDGMVSGLSVNVGENGFTGRVEIRGRNTMLANQNPLYVVDGFPISSNILTINPEDVESIFVLKDAAATAQWGVQASNGVVVVTTKKAKGGKMSVDYSSYYSIDESIKFSKQNWMTTAQEVALDQEYIDKKWFAFPTLVSSRNAFNQVQLGNIYRQGVSPDGNIWTENTFQNYISTLAGNSAASQWEDLMYRQAKRQIHNLSISGNTTKNSINASVVFNDDLLKEIGNTDRRVILNIRDEFKLSSRLSFYASMNASFRKQKNNGTHASAVNNVNAYDNLVDEYGRTIQYSTRWDPWTIRSKEAIPGFFKYTYNALDEMRNRDLNSQQTDIRTQFGVNYEPVKGLNVESKFQYEKGFSRTDNYYSMDLPSHRILVNDMFLAPTKEYQIPVGSRYFYGRNEMYSVNWRNTLSYVKRFGDHDISFLTGFDIKKVYFENFGDNVYGFDKQTNTHIPINNNDYQAGRKFNWNGERVYFSFMSTSNADTREVGFYAMPGYTYKGKYTVNANYRVDQKNLFGSDPRFRYKPLWSIGGAWLISKEKFMNSVSWVNRLNLKGSYGITGNASNNYSPYAQAVNASGSWGANLFTYLRLTQPANPNLKWEETRALNIELEFQVLNKKLDGSINFYHENSVDLLGTRVLDPTSGFASGVVNYASLKNNGIELSLNSRIIQTKDFSWDASININYNKNKVTKIDDQKRTPYALAYSGDLALGLPLENLYSFNYAGVSSGGEPQLYAADKTIKLWRKLVQTKDELIYHGTTVAPYYGGFQTTLAYKGIDLSMNLTFKAGHYFRYYIPTGLTGLTSRMDEVWATRWMKPGDENSTRVPKIAYEGINPYTGTNETRWDNTDGDQYFTYGQDWIFKADFIKVRDIILGYNMPAGIIKKAFMNSLRFTIQVTNPVQWFKNPRGVDPENYTTAAYTNLKTITFGLRAGF